MTNDELLIKAFREALDLPADAEVETLEYNRIPQWDSIAHMALISRLDEAFDIMIDTADIIELSSFAKAKEIIGKYGVTFQ